LVDQLLVTDFSVCRENHVQVVDLSPLVVMKSVCLDKLFTMILQGVQSLDHRDESLPYSLLVVSF
jgi:hypothetical protein